jgi:acetylornithine deacetylase/succinyl-diaminopimelate desuccinylase-like protein
VPLTTAERAVLDKIDEAYLVELTRSLLRADGQNPPGDEAATVTVLAAAAAELGLDGSETSVQPGRNNLRVTLPGGAGPGLLLLGHTDVVPVGDGGRKARSVARSRRAGSTAAAPRT